jgi:hypothetical protein
VYVASRPISQQMAAAKTAQAGQVRIVIVTRRRRPGLRRHRAHSVSLCNVDAILADGE